MKLTGLSILGVVTTAIFTGLATYDAYETLHNENLSEVEKAVTVLPQYIPAILTGCGTVVCILGDSVFNRKKQNSITSAYILLEQYIKEYRRQVAERYGEEVEEEIHGEAIRNYYRHHSWDSDIPDQKLCWYEPITGQYFERYEREVIDAEYHFNRNFILGCAGTLNEFLGMLGVDQADDRELSWDMQAGYQWVDFEHVPSKRIHHGKQVFEIWPLFLPEDAAYWDYE